VQTWLDTAAYAYSYYLSVENNTTTMAAPPKVFISYASEQSDFAELMKMKLEAASVEVWRDAHEIVAGEEWRNEIDYGLLNADAIIVLLTPAAAASAYVTYEWAFALGNGKRVLPVLLADCDIHPRLSVFQYLDFTARRRPWGKLTQRVQELHQQETQYQAKEDEPTLEELFEGIRSLINADKEKGAQTFTKAASRMINASHYLRGVDKNLQTILWVDDSPVNKAFERKALAALGFTFDLAANTAEALQLLKSKTYAAIVSDMGRKEGPQEGYVLLKALRQTDDSTPFFIYSSSNKPEHKEMARERGAQGATNRADELIDLVTTHTRRQPK